MKKKILNTEDCRSLIKMLSASDEDANVAYGVIENCDIDKNLPQILIVLKHASVTKKMLQDESKSLFKKIDKKIPSNGSDYDLRWKTIYDLVDLDNEHSISTFENIFEKYAEDCFDQVFSFVEDITLTYKWSKQKQKS